MFIITKILAHEHVKDVLFDLLYGVFFFFFLSIGVLFHFKTFNNHHQ